MSRDGAARHSDTVLAEDALHEALKPFAEARVTVVTGLVLALSRRRNLLTRLTDLRYANSFLFERAAYSSSARCSARAGRSPSTART